MSQKNTNESFSNYGAYAVGDELELLLPNTQIKLEKIAKNTFSYFRRDSEGNISEKIIPTESDDLHVELAPIRPLNHPARRTGYMFLQFDKEIYLNHNSAASIFVHCPVEIGIFLVGGASKESLDWVTCNPVNSRFGLYGLPDTGILCKYAEVTLATDFSDSIPYIECVLKIVVENTLDSGQTVSKTVFPITDNSLYYENSKTILDGLKVTLKKRAGLNIADVQVEPLDTDWTKSPTWEDTTTNTAMEMGLE